MARGCAGISHSVADSPSPHVCVYWSVPIAESYLVDPASNHMLLSKIKPCMSKFTLVNGDTANGSLNQPRVLTCQDPTWIKVAILELI